jgi:hypothetical protein
VILEILSEPPQPVTSSFIPTGLLFATTLSSIRRYLKLINKLEHFPYGGRDEYSQQSRDRAYASPAGIAVASGS